MERPRRPRAVTAGGVVALVFGILKCVGIPLAFLAALAEESGPQPGPVQFAFAGVAVAMSVAQVAFSILLLQSRKSSYRPLLAVTFVGALLGMGQVINGNIPVLQAVAIDVAILVLLFLPASRAWYLSEETPAA